MRKDKTNWEPDWKIITVGLIAAILLVSAGYIVGKQAANNALPTTIPAPTDQELGKAYCNERNMTLNIISCGGYFQIDNKCAVGCIILNKIDKTAKYANYCVVKNDYVLYTTDYTPYGGIC